MDEQEQLLAWSDDIYRFALLVMDVMKQPRDYGTGELLNMVEIHTISMIAAEPGLCVSDIARKWNRTLGAASRNVDRLVSKGYVTKQKMAGNDKTVHLYVTPLGSRLAEAHSRFDREMAARYFRTARKSCSMEDLEKFHTVLQTLYRFFEDQSSLGK